MSQVFDATFGKEDLLNQNKSSKSISKKQNSQKPEPSECIFLISVNTKK